MIKNIHNKMRQGFTLIELSIVIIIIGILAAGSVVGGKVIENAKFSKFLSDFNELRNGIVTFQTTYAALPGDYDGAYAVSGTASGKATNGVIYKGDGDGFIVADASGSNDESVSGINHLTEEGFIDVGFSRLSDPGFKTKVSGGSVTYVTGKFPKSYGEKGLEWYFKSAIPKDTSSGSSSVLTQNVIAIRDADMHNRYLDETTLDHILGEKIDLKLDDGKVNTGSIQGFRTNYAEYKDSGTSPTDQDGCNPPTHEAGGETHDAVRCGLRYIIEDL